MKPIEQSHYLTTDVPLAPNEARCACSYIATPERVEAHIARCAARRQPVRVIGDDEKPCHGCGCPSKPPTGYSDRWPWRGIAEGCTNAHCVCHGNPRPTLAVSR